MNLARAPQVENYFKKCILGFLDGLLRKFFSWVFQNLFELQITNSDETNLF